MRKLINKEVIKAYLETTSGKNLQSRLIEFEKQNSITQQQKEEIIAIKAKEYNSFNNPKNAWDCVKVFLNEFPEIFDIMDIITSNIPKEKFYFVIDSKCMLEMEKILRFKGVNFKKIDKVVNNKQISFIVGYLENPDRYTLENNPVRQIWSLAEDSGIRIGHYVYPNWEGAYYSLGLFRSFPILDEDSYGNYSRAFGGLREDLNAGFKSSWEANIARILNYKGVDWKYEVLSHGFKVETGYYIPDFTVYHSNSSFTILEVKGFWDSESLKKMWSFRHTYPDEELIIIDKDYYALLEKKYKQNIQNWEETKNLDKTQIIPVYGLFVDNRITTIKDLKEGDCLTLKREADNPFDIYAIKIVTDDGRDVGYMAKEWAAIYSLKMEKGLNFKTILKKKALESKRLDIEVEMISDMDVLMDIGL